ncbi:MAG: glycosyltransferase family protein, partial [Planctomycetota bacterium]
MARIVYSMSGEGRGHATRVHTVISMLVPQHEVRVFAPPAAHHLLQESLAGFENVRLDPLPSMEFQYSNGHLNYLRSILGNVPFLWNLNRRVRELADEIQQWNPSLALCDFEPLLPRAAHRLGIQVVSLDHQHFLTAIDESPLPWQMRMKVRMLRPSVNLFCPNPTHQIISSYYKYRVRKNQRNVFTVPTLLRQEVIDAESSVG